MTVSELWDRNARERPHRTAIEDPGRSLTWAEAKRWIDRVALGLLELGIQRDEVLVVQLPNSVELHLLRVACEKAGIRCTPVTSNMRRREVEHILTRTGAAGVVVPGVYRGFDYITMIREIRPALAGLRFIFVTGEEAPEGTLSIARLAAEPVEEKYPPGYLEKRRYRAEEISLIGHSSGSTGVPKLVQYSPSTCAAAGKWFAKHLRLTPDDVVAALAPAARGPNLPVYFAAPWAGAKIVMLAWSEPRKALTAIQDKKVTIACLVPAQATMMLEEAQARRYDLSSVRAWVSAGAYFPPPLIAAVEERMGGIVLNYYGSMELGAVTSCGLDDPAEVRRTTAGRPTFGVELRIVDEEGRDVGRGAGGEILARCLCSSSGFYNDEEATRELWNEEGWAATGDIGLIDESGNLVIVGRKKDVIIRGGQNIYPAEIEALLIAHPKVQDVAVVAMPDPVMGERACACVVPVKGERLSFEEMISFLKEKKIASFKLPERLELFDQFPTVADGYKVDKKALRQDMAEKLSQEKKVAR